MATGGVQSLPTDSQPIVVTTLKASEADDVIGLSKTPDSSLLMAYVIPRSIRPMEFLYSSPDLPETGSTVYLRTDGDCGADSQWNGYMTGSLKYKGGESTALTVR